MYFEKGDEISPKGHALVYFRDRNDTDSIFATYIIALPISVDVSKYIPPMFASQMQGMSTQDLNGFAFPPMPEKMDDIESVRSLAEMRGDYLIDGGTGVESDDHAGTARFIIDSGGSTAHHLMDLRNNNESIFYVEGAKVGIGTNDPTARLSVSSSVQGGKPKQAERDTIKIILNYPLHFSIGSISKCQTNGRS